MRLKKKDLAAKLPVSERSLTVWQREGMPVLEHGRRGQQNVYDLAAVVAWIKRTGRGFRSVDMERLERELGLNQQPQVAPALPKFPDLQTMRAIESAMGASLVKSAAVMVRLLGLEPDAALKCWEITTGEIGSAFADAHGFDTGPVHTRGDWRELNEIGGRQRLTDRIARLAAELGQSDVDMYDYEDDDY